MPFNPGVISTECDVYILGAPTTDVTCMHALAATTPNEAWSHLLPVLVRSLSETCQQTLLSLTVSLRASWQKYAVCPCGRLYFVFVGPAQAIALDQCAPLTFLNNGPPFQPLTVIHFLVDVVQVLDQPIQ